MRPSAAALPAPSVGGVGRYPGDETLIAATRQARAILTKAEEVNFLSGRGRGVILIKLTSPEDRVLGFVASTGDLDLLTVETSRGAEQRTPTDLPVARSARAPPLFDAAGDAQIRDYYQSNP